MKTLAQIEARTAIESLPFVISSPGSYYVTKNLQNATVNQTAISIDSSNVTLDLNGFTLSSIPGVIYGAIYVAPGRTNIEIKNGNIVGNINLAGFTNGISCAYGPRNLKIDRINVSGCGIGIIASHAILTDCSAHANGNIGLSADNGLIVNSTAYGNGGIGLVANYGSILNCVATSNGSHGIYSDNGIIAHSTANENGGTGISASLGTVTHAHVRGNGFAGILCSGGSVSDSKATSTTAQPAITCDTADNCSGNATSGNAIECATATNCKGTSTSGIGISALTGGVTNCKGTSVSGIGIDCFNATNSIGFSTSGIGLRADTASNCTGSSATDDGIFCHGVATNCAGTSGITGKSGIFAGGTASYCRGYGNNGAVAISASIAVACTAPSGVINSPEKHLGTP